MDLCDRCGNQLFRTAMPSVDQFGEPVWDAVQYCPVCEAANDDTGALSMDTPDMF